MREAAVRELGMHLRMWSKVWSLALVWGGWGCGSSKERMLQQRRERGVQGREGRKGRAGGEGRWQRGILNVEDAREGAGRLWSWMMHHLRVE